MKTKNRIQTFLSTLLASAMLVIAAAGSARALNNAEADMKMLNQSEGARHVGISSSTPGQAMAALNLYYVGSATESVITVPVFGAAADIKFYAPGGTLDTSVGTTGSISTTTYSTLGTFCDLVNASANYVCTMKDGRRSDSINTLAGQTAINGLYSLKAAGGYDVAITTGLNSIQANTVQYLSIGITPKAGKRVVLKKCEFSANSSGLALPTLSVSGVVRNLGNAGDGVTRDDSTVVWSSVITSSNSALTQSWGDTGVGGWAFQDSADVQKFGLGNVPVVDFSGRVVVRVASDVTTTIQAAANYLNCFWLER